MDSRVANDVFSQWPSSDNECRKRSETYHRSLDQSLWRRIDCCKRDSGTRRGRLSILLMHCLGNIFVLLRKVLIGLLSGMQQSFKALDFRIGLLRTISQS